MSTLSYDSVHLRRMHWAVFSPSLLSYDFNAEYVKDDHHKNSILRLLAQFNTESSKIESHFQSFGAIPMGKYFEQLLFFVLERDSRYEVLLKNHQIIQQKETVGEIDLILKDTKTDAIEHWEIALKYYLQSEASPEHNVMLGPNANDNLAKKMRKLTLHQLPLTTDLSDIGIGNTSTIENKLFLKGQFFYHLSRHRRCNIFANHINPSHEMGWWCRLSEVDGISEENLVWTTIRKPNWIGSVNLGNNRKVLNDNGLKDELITHFKQEIHSVLCVGLRQENGRFIEQSRGFVVNDRWPNGSK